MYRSASIWSPDLTKTSRRGIPKATRQFPKGLTSRSDWGGLIIPFEVRLHTFLEAGRGGGGKNKEKKINNGKFWHERIRPKYRLSPLK